MRTTLIILCVLVLAALTPAGIERIQAQAPANIWLIASQPDGYTLRVYDGVQCRVAAVDGSTVRLACVVKAAPDTPTPRPTATRQPTITPRPGVTKTLAVYPWPWVTYAQPTYTRQPVTATVTPYPPTATATQTRTQTPTATDAPPTPTETVAWPYPPYPYPYP